LPVVRRTATAVVLAVTMAAGCGGSSTPAPKHGAPDLQAFLRLPVATPSECGGTISGATAGRKSPWVGTVDVSVFLVPTATAEQVQALRGQLEAMPQVRAVYFESAEQAYAEFQRLYTCSADVPRTAVPASYRLVLGDVTRPQRDDLVTRIRALPGVKSVSCDPSSPCVS
jgi:hypothetical protein